MEGNSTFQRVKEIALIAVGECGVEFVHLEFAGTKRNLVVRVFVDKPGGVTIEDCGKVSRTMEAVMDAEDIIPRAYVLEVSSPGLDRELYSIDDFVKFVGSAAKVRTKVADGTIASLNGVIAGVAEGMIEFDDRSKGRVSFPYDSVVKANLKVDIQQELKRN